MESLLQLIESMTAGTYIGLFINMIEIKFSMPSIFVA